MAELRARRYSLAVLKGACGHCPQPERFSREWGSARVSHAPGFGVPPTSPPAGSRHHSTQSICSHVHRRDADESDRDGRGPRSQLPRSGQGQPMKKRNAAFMRQCHPWSSIWDRPCPTRCAKLANMQNALPAKEAIEVPAVSDQTRTGLHRKPTVNAPQMVGISP